MLPAWPPPVLRRAIGGKRANIATDRDSIASSTVGTMMPSAPTSTALCTFVSVASGMRMMGVAAARGHAAIIFSISSNRSVACCISKREKSNFAAPSQYALTSNDVIGLAEDLLAFEHLLLRRVVERLRRVVHEGANGPAPGPPRVDGRSAWLCRARRSGRGRDRPGQVRLPGPAHPCGTANRTPASRQPAATRPARGTFIWPPSVCEWCGSLARRPAAIPSATDSAWQAARSICAAARAGQDGSCRAARGMSACPATVPFASGNLTLDGASMSAAVSASRRSRSRCAPFVHAASTSRSGGSSRDVVDPLSAVEVRRERIAFFDAKRLEQIEPRAREVRRDERCAVGGGRRPFRGLLVAEAVETVSKEHGVEAKNLGERGDSGIHGSHSGFRFRFTTIGP